MKRRIAWLFLIGVAVLFLVIAWILLHPQEIVHQGKPLSEWARQMKSHQPAEVEAARQAFLDMEHQAVPRLIGVLLGERNVFERVQDRARVHGPGWLRKRLPPSSMRERGLFHRAGAAEALGLIAPQDPKVLRALTAALRDPQPTVSGQAAALLARAGPPGIEALDEAMDPAESETTRAVSAYGYSTLKQPSRLALAKAAGRLSDPSARVRGILVGVLERSDAANLLVQQLDSDVRVAQMAAMETLRRIGPRAGYDTGAALLPLLRHDSVQVRLAAMEAIYRVWLGRDEAVEALAPMVKDTDPNVRATAAKLLAARARFRPLPNLDPVEQALNDSHPESRGWAAVALGCMPDEAAPHIKRLKALTSDSDEFVRTNAVNSLQRIKRFETEPDTPAARR